MTLPFVCLAALTLASAAAAMALPKLVHCAFCLVLTFLGLAGLYLGLNAEFVGWVQVLVYVGAVAILIVFAILLTRDGGTPGTRLNASSAAGLVIAGLVCAALTGTVISSSAIRQVAPREYTAQVKDIGARLMDDYVVPLEAMGLLLTAALIGAVIIAMRDRPAPPAPRQTTSPRGPDSAP